MLRRDHLRHLLDQGQHWISDDVCIDGEFLKAVISSLVVICQCTSMDWTPPHFIFSMLQPSEIATAVSFGTIPASDCALANAFSTSIMRETYCLSEKMFLASSVPNRFRKIRESIAVAFIVRDVWITKISRVGWILISSVLLSRRRQSRRSRYGQSIGYYIGDSRI